MRLAFKLLIILLLAMGCNLTARQPTTPTPPASSPLVSTLPPVNNTNPNPPAAPVVNPDCPTTPSDWTLYTVEPGDSLSLLAEQTGSTVEELAAGNCLGNADEIYVEQVLYLPRQPQASP